MAEKTLREFSTPTTTNIQTRLAVNSAVHEWCTAAAVTRRIFTAHMGGECCVDVCTAANNKYVNDALGACGANTRVYIRYVIFW